MADEDTLGMERETPQAPRRFAVGDRVRRDPLTWVPNAFDEWGRGEGTGTVVEPPFPMGEDEVDVCWPNGRCFERTGGLLPAHFEQSSD